MRAYLDVGVFVDYLGERSHAGGLLRTADRRGRTPPQLADDAARCIQRLSNRHESFTSSITLFEAERTLFEALRRASTGVPDRYRYLVPSARAIVTQMLIAIDYNQIRVVALEAHHFQDIATNLGLQSEAVRAADAIHMVTAIRTDIDIILSADNDILSLDRQFQNTAGIPIRCVDTDQGLHLL